MVVPSFVTTAFPARPNWSSRVFSSLSPSSSVMTSPPVRMAMSSSILLRLSPKSGALIAATSSAPRALLRIRAASASPSRSSEMIRSGLLDCMTWFRSGKRSWTLLIFWPAIRMLGSSRTASILSWSVTRCGET
jgi:hypothetical protein